MALQKTAEEIELIRNSALLVSKTRGMLASEIKPGVTTLELDKKAETFIRDHGANPVGVVIGLDRCERGVGAQSAVEEVQTSLGLTVTSVITMHDIIEWLEMQPELNGSLQKMNAYREQYGV